MGIPDTCRGVSAEKTKRLRYCRLTDLEEQKRHKRRADGCHGESTNSARRAAAEAHAILANFAEHDACGGCRNTCPESALTL